MDDCLDKTTLRLVVAQICLSLGWHSVTRFTLEILTDVIEKYLKKISVSVAGVCQHDGRLSPTLNDVNRVFEYLGISSLELEDYLHQVEQVSFCRPLPQYPIQKPNQLKHPTSSEERPDYCEPHHPPLVNVHEQLSQDIVQPEETITDKVDDNQTEESEALAKAKRPGTVSRKRSYDSPPYSPVEPKRLNLDAQPLLTDLTRPDLKVSTPKEPFGVQVFDDVREVHEPSKGHDEQDKVDTKPVASQNKSAVEASKPKKISIIEKKDNFQHEILPQSPRADKFLQPKYASASPHSSEIEKKVLMSPPKQTVEKPERSALSFISSVPPPKLSPSLSPSPSKVNPRQSPKPPSTPKPIRSPQTPESGKKASGPSNKELPCIKSPEITLPAATTPIKKLTKVKKGKGNAGQPEKKKKKKEKKVLEVKEEKVNSPVKLKISSLKLFEDSKQTKKKKSPKLSQKENPSSGPASLIPEKPPVPKIVFKPLIAPSSAPAFPMEASVMSVVQKKEKLLGKKGSTDGKVKKKKKKLKMALSEENVKEGVIEQKGEGKKKGKEKKGSLKLAISKSKVQSKSIIPSRDTEGENTLKFKLEQTSDDMTKITLSSTSSKGLESPSKKLTSPTDIGSSLVTSINLKSPTMETGPSKKKIKLEKKKKPKVVEGINDPSSNVKVKKVKNKGEEKKIKTKDLSKDISVKPTKAKKKAKKEPPLPPEIPPIPKLTLKMDSSATPIATNTSSSKLILKPSTSPTKTPEASTKKAKSQSITVSKAPYSVPSTPPASKKSGTTAVLPPAPPPPAAASLMEDTPQRGVFTVTLATTNVATAEVYYCPACQRPDDGSPMIGCDGCDLWYHWPCVGIYYAPKDDEQWFCPACRDKQKKKKRKKKDS